MLCEDRQTGTNFTNVNNSLQPGCFVRHRTLTFVSPAASAQREPLTYGAANSRHVCDVGPDIYMMNGMVPVLATIEACVRTKCRPRKGLRKQPCVGANMWSWVAVISLIRARAKAQKLILHAVDVSYR